MRWAQRTPCYLPDPRGVGLTIDLSSVPEPGTMSYWKTCLRMMHLEVDRLRESARSGQTTHLSVFAFALIPLLVALGYALDDTIDTDIYSRHRGADSWHWDPQADAVEFVSRIPDTTGVTEAVVMVNASGTIQSSELPNAVRNLPCIIVEPSGNHTPSPTTCASWATLDSFTSTFRDLLADLERHKHISRLHLFLRRANRCSRQHRPGLATRQRSSIGHRLPPHQPRLPSRHHTPHRGGLDNGTRNLL